MNLNYVGSVAERFMKFRSTLASETRVSEDIFNAVSIYVPKTLAKTNLATGSYSEDSVTADTYAVITVTVDNYKDVLAPGSNLLTQWLPVFNDGTNSAVTLYIIVFDDTGFAVTATAGAVTWEPLTKAFNELYFISFFKTMFSEHYDGSKDTDGSTYDDSNFFDMALCLSYLCEMESTLSFCLIELKLKMFANGGADENICKILSYARGDETAKCTTLEGSTLEDRAEYFWGYVNLIGGAHTEIHINNGEFMLPWILGSWFKEKNGTGTFVGNKLAKIRLTGNGIKPTGVPSPLNSDVNLNPASSIVTVLDEKFVGYFISIANDSDSDVEFIRDRSISNFPITAYMISKWIDYTSSQDMAKFATNISTRTKPVLANQTTYKNIQGILIGNIQKFAGLGRLENIAVNFPPFAQAKVGQTFQGTAVWKAYYIDDLEGVDISGEIAF